MAATSDLVCKHSFSRLSCGLLAAAHTTSGLQRHFFSPAGCTGHTTLAAQLWLACLSLASLSLARCCSMKSSGSSGCCSSSSVIRLCQSARKSFRQAYASSSSTWAASYAGRREVDAKADGVRCSSAVCLPGASVG